ncbi:MAG: glycosyltransferase [Endomicrobium sp.]|jgi:glycosyltransferase involved in cell wall biosynthesis|nr:glycosyltransferase [Endomicrobium sp.]
MNSPKVSVIIPVYNTEKYLRQCLDSVANQTLKDIEIICINDGSTDNSLQILNEYANRDSRFIILQQKNAGSAIARNSALRIVRGKYFAFMDADDFYPTNEVLQSLYNTSENEGALVCGGSLSLCNAKGKSIKNNFQESCFIKNQLMDFKDYQYDYYYQRFIYNSSLLKNNDLYFPDLIRYQDPPWVIKCMAHAEKFYAIKNITYCYRAGHKPYTSELNFIQAVAIAKGLKLSLELTKKYNYETLHSKIVERINNNSFTTLFKNKVRENSNIEYILKDTLSSLKQDTKFFFNDFWIAYTNYPKVSVIIPVYNTEKYLRQCLDSVVNQTLKDIEIICVNDGSTDKSLTILRDYASKDSRIVVIDSINEGAGASRNKGIRISHGKYVGFVDSDDWLDLNYYGNLYSVAEEQNADLVRTSYFYERFNVQEKEKFLSGLFERKKLKKESLSLNVNEHTVVIWNAIYKQNYIIKNDIYFNNSRSQNDIFWTARATYFSKKTIGTDNTYYHYRCNQNIDGQLSLTTKFNLIQRVDSLIHSNKITLDFINSVEYKSKEDYIIAYKRCLWRYDDQFWKYLKFDEFTKDMKKRLFGEFTSAFNRFKCKKSCQNESYYKFIKNNDFEGYVKSLNQKNKIIISLTSYPPRINVVHKAILTLLEQTKKADKIILWLANEDFPNKEKDLPRELTELTTRGLTISWCKDIKSYKKLIPTVREYPEYAIVTADDDVYYHKDWLEKLYIAYIKQPNAVHCYRARIITFKYGKISPYLQWNFYLVGSHKPNPSFRNFPTGCGGILYPPHVFYKDLLREDLFLKLLPSTDDIWFWAMCVLNNIKINSVKKNTAYVKNVENTQKSSLWSINKNNINDENLQKIFHLYPKLYKKIRKYTIPYREYAQWVFCIYNENIHKVFKIFGLKIKLRKERLLKFRKNITMFLENILCIKNNGVYKIIGIFGIKIKIKRKHKELLLKLTEQEKSIKNLKDEIKNIVFSQTQDFKKELINICKNNEHLNYTQLESLFWLSKRLKIKNSLPPMRNWAMSPDVLLKLHEYITNAKPKIILEFGSGVSTIVICDALSQNNSGHLISIEHLEKFIKETVEVIKNENLSSFLDLRLAQLKIWVGEHLCNEKPVFWYDEKVIDTSDLKDIDLLIIDGPPGNTNPYARYPTLQILYKKLSNKAQVWLDDSKRKDEDIIVQTWVEKYKLIPNFFNLEKGLVVLEKLRRA